MKYFFDTEFHEYLNNGVPTIELISIGIVCEDGRELYRVSNEFDINAAIYNDWLRENVIKGIYIELDGTEEIESRKHAFYWQVKDVLDKHGKCRQYIKEDILEFIGSDTNPEFYAYYGDYDWVVFCWLFGRMMDLPKGFPMYCRDLKQMLDDKYMHQVNRYEGKTRLESWLQDVKRMPNYPKQENEHNALDDAKWNKSLYGFIHELKEAAV